MGKVIFQISMSLDGFITGPGIPLKTDSARAAKRSMSGCLKGMALTS